MREPCVGGTLCPPHLGNKTIWRRRATVGRGCPPFENVSSSRCGNLARVPMKLLSVSLWSDVPLAGQIALECGVIAVDGWLKVGRIATQG